MKVREEIKRTIGHYYNDSLRPNKRLEESIIKHVHHRSEKYQNWLELVNELNVKLQTSVQDITNGQRPCFEASYKMNISRNRNLLPGESQWVFLQKSIIGDFCSVYGLSDLSWTNSIEIPSHKAMEHFVSSSDYTSNLYNSVCEAFYQQFSFNHFLSFSDYSAVIEGNDGTKRTVFNLLFAEFNFNNYEIIGDIKKCF
ncbi:hypothetical protein [Roseivirga sp.]|uniref:hypothetical protein n=1 Tax=Roseivirga sp. TaxID=1964215 RepID=UPI003B517382